MDDERIRFPEVPGRGKPRGGGILGRFAFTALITLGSGIIMTHAIVGMISLEAIAAYGLSQAILLCAALSIGNQPMFHGSTVDAGGDTARRFVAQLYFRGLDWLVFSVLIFLTGAPIAVGAAAGSAVVLPIKFFLYKDAIVVQRVHRPAPVDAGRAAESRSKLRRASGS